MLSYADYVKSGYTVIPEAEFERYAIRAFLDAKRFTFDRIGEDNLTEYNKRGIFEIAELYYKDDRQIDRPVVSASNNGYSEAYAVRNTAAENVENTAYSIAQVYFTREQLCRGVVYV